MTEVPTNPISIKKKKQSVLGFEFIFYAIQKCQQN